MSQENQKIFALDIGTRTVVGLVVEPLEDNKYQVIDCEVMEHGERSMLDGQIHDIMAVAEVIGQVRKNLSEKHGPLHQVAVAAAGRSLRTRRVHVELDIRHRDTLLRDDILALELSAVQEAQAQLAQELNEQDTTRYYCVGYSVINYYLDNEIIGSLIDQRGELVRVDIIATFLPRVVVDSLLTSLKRCDLEMQALTLEPIAAINVLIPQTMRRLNISLVDIGAGTSDVALTAEGTVTAYGMVPMAGDEITDALMNALLLDFPVAESVKRCLSSQEEITFQDILGIDHTLSKSEVVAAIDEEIKRLAEKIGEKILELNGKAPQAVMLIGGGSLTPTLPEKIANILNIPAARVAVRGTDAIQQLIGTHPLINGPEFVTPLGIAVAARKQPIKYITITVNEKQVRIFDLRKMTLGDALLAVGIDMRRLYGRPGLAKTVTVNSRLRFLPGGHGTAPLITQNGEPAGLDSELSDGDDIVVVPGQDGQEAHATVFDLLEEADTLDLICNGQPLSLPPQAMINGETVELDTILADRDIVDIRLPRTVEEVLQGAGLITTENERSQPTQLRFRVNGQSYTVPLEQTHLTINNKPVQLTDRIRLGDELVYRVESLRPPRIADVVQPEEWEQHQITVTFNGQPITLSTTTVSITMNGVSATGESVISHDADIQVKATVGPNPVFSDVFRYVNISFDQQSGTRLCTKINGESASYQTEIKSGDKLELYWE